jgi:hypothetical protein
MTKRNLGRNEFQLTSVEIHIFGRLTSSKLFVEEPVAVPRRPEGNRLQQHSNASEEIRSIDMLASRSQTEFQLTKNSIRL